MYDIAKIKKEIKALNMPKEYFRIDLDVFNTHDYYMILSIRQDAGKTTQSLLLGMVLFKLYGKTTEYLRCDESQITRKNISKVYEVIRKFDYIPKLFNNEYNDVEYKPMLKQFNLVYKDEEGNITKRCDRPLFVAHSLEMCIDEKSGYNNTEGDYVVLDEFLDSSRNTSGQMEELANVISTVTRIREDAHVIMLGNNTNQYSFWWEEFCIEDDIPNLKYGSYIDKVTSLGTSFYCALWEVSEKKKEQVKNKLIRFFGFDTPKMNAFNGIGEWSGRIHPHIPNKEMLFNTYLVYDRLYIRHRNRYVKIKVFNNEDGMYCYLHYANKPLLDDNIVLTLDPLYKNDVFGSGRYMRDKIRNKLAAVINLRVQKRWYYASNSVGELVQDYFKELRY